MPRNFKELQAKMDSADRSDNRQRVRDELKRMALDELRSARQLTQADMAEMLDVPQSSISRIERRADMYLSTLRNYIHAMGGVLQIQAVFPDGGSVVIDRFGDYENATYIVWARAERKGTYRLLARPFQNVGAELSTKPLKPSAFVKSMKALHLPEAHISEVTKRLQNAGELQIGANGSGIVRFFSAPDLAAAGFEATRTGRTND
jgi:transcriptional regulator with XRE-family HTH domain